VCVPGSCRMGCVCNYYTCCTYHACSTYVCPPFPGMEGAQKVRARRTTPPVCVLAAHRGRTAAVGGSIALASFFFFPLPFSSLDHFPLAPFSSLAHFGIKVSSDGRAQPWAAVGAAVTPRVDGGGGGAGRQGPARERVKRAHARRGRFPLRLLPLGRARSLWKLKVRAVEQADGVWRCSEAKPGLSRDLVRGRADVRAQSGVERSVVLEVTALRPPLLAVALNSQCAGPYMDAIGTELSIETTRAQDRAGRVRGARVAARPGVGCPPTALPIRVGTGRH